MGKIYYAEKLPLWVWVIIMQYIKLLDYFYCNYYYL